MLGVTIKTTSAHPVQKGSFLDKIINIAQASIYCIILITCNSAQLLDTKTINHYADKLKIIQKPSFKRANSVTSDLVASDARITLQARGEYS
jgi:hypothetical protein